MNKKITLLLLGLFAVACNAKPTNAFTSPFSIDNTDFTLNNSIGTSSAAGNSVINTTANPNGFNSQFDTTGGNTFLLLGAGDSSNTIDGGSNASQDRTNVEGISSPFTITNENINAGINLEFDWSFQGTNDANDEFFVAIESTNRSIFKAILEQDSYGDGTFDGNVNLSSFSPGEYNLIVSLSESRNVGNSAAGFDNISLSEVNPATPPTPVPFGTSTNTGIFILGSLYAGSSYIKRRKMKG